MRIVGLHIERFGIWAGLKIERLPKGVCVFYGPNEAGKTTLLQFLRSMLFGYFDEVRDYVPAISSGNGLLGGGSRGGGSLAVVSGNIEYHIRRYVSLTDATDRVGDLRVTANNSERIGSHRLATLLNGLDETIFNNVFAVGLRELQQLATLDATEVGRQLYQLSTGTDRVSLVDVTRQLQDVRRRILGEPGEQEDTFLSQLTQEMRRCQNAIQGDASLTRYASLHASLNQISDETAHLEQEQARLHRELRLAELSISAGPLIHRRKEFDRELAILGNPGPVAAEAIAQISESDRQVAEQQARRQKLEEKREQLRQQISALEPPAIWARVASRLQSVLEQRQAIERADAMVRRLKTEHQAVEAELADEQTRLGKSAGTSHKFATQLMELEALVTAAEQEQAEFSALDVARQEHAKQQKELERLDRSIQEGLNKDPELFDQEDRQDIIAAVKRTGQIAERLRKRHQLEGRRQELTQQLQTAQARQNHALRTNLLPWEVLQAIGILFAIGVFCVLLAMFHDRAGLTTASRNGLAWMGGIAMVVAGSLKFLLESTGSEEKHRWTTIHTRATHELSRITAALDELNAEIPTRRSQPIRLEDAQNRLARLELILPLEEQRRRMRMQIEKTSVRIHELEQLSKEASSRWHEALRQNGLSPQLSIEQVRKWIGETGRLAPLQQRLKDLSEQLRSAEQDYSQWHVRLTSLAEDAGSSAGASAQEILEQLTALATKVERDRGQRDVLRDQERRLRDEIQEVAHEIRQNERARLALLRQHRASDLAELKQRHESSLRREQLVSARDALQKDLLRMLAEFSESELDISEVDTAAANLKAAIASRREAVRALEEQIKAAAERKGEISGQIQLLATDRVSARAKLDESVLENRLREAFDQFQVVSAMNHLLKSVYKRYERERQPDTLRDASQYFRRMSGDRYTRVWTPLADDILLADEATGRTIPVTQLSSGTREQVYLSLRLALAASYARRGIELPVILDDVLVNFDVERTQAAAEVLLEFSQQGHQVLLFTCHQHVTEIFRRLRVEVRELPKRDFVVAREPPGLPNPIKLPEPPPPTAQPAKPVPVTGVMVLGFAGRRRPRVRPGRMRRGRTRRHSPKALNLSPPRNR